MDFPSASDSASRSASATLENLEGFKARVAAGISDIAGRGGRVLHIPTLVQQQEPGTIEQMAEFLKGLGYQAWVEAFGSPETATLVVKW